MVTERTECRWQCGPWRRVGRAVRRGRPFLLGSAAMLGVMLCGTTTGQATVAQEFSRYQVILDRRPFGEAALASTAESVTPVAPRGPAFTQQLRMCAITARGGRIRVGFLDTGVKPEKTHFLFVGESEDGYEVVEADYEKEAARLRKDGREEWISMRGADDAGFVAGAASRGYTGPVSPTTRSRVVVPPSNITRNRYEREVELGTRARPRSAVTAYKNYLDAREKRSGTEDEGQEQRESALRQYNMELIRAGGAKGPALPIPLSAEEDAQLVKEGVLAPVAE